MVFPLPVLPMTAVVRPGRATRSTPHSTGSSAPGYRKSTARSSSSPCRCSGVTGAGGGASVGSVSRTSWMRSAQTSARGIITNMNVAIITDMRICSR